MSSQKNNIIFAFLMVLTIFAMVIVDANNDSNTGQSLTESPLVSDQIQAPCGQSSGGCPVSSSNTGGCCSTGDAESSLDSVENAAFAYYVDMYGDPNVSIKVNDYGCHQEIEVIKDGSVIMMLGYNGEVYEL